MGFSGMPKKKVQSKAHAGGLDKKVPLKAPTSKGKPKNEKTKSDKTPVGHHAWTVIKTVFRPGRSYHVLKLGHGGREWIGFLPLGDEAGRSNLHEDIGKTILCKTVNAHRAGWAALSRAEAAATSPVRICKREYTGVVLCRLSDGLVFVDIGDGSVVDAKFAENRKLNPGDEIRFIPFRFPQEPRCNPQIRASLRPQ